MLWYWFRHHQRWTANSRSSWDIGSQNQSEFKTFWSQCFYSGRYEKLGRKRGRISASWYHLGALCIPLKQRWNFENTLLFGDFGICARFAFSFGSEGAKSYCQASQRCPRQASCVGHTKQRINLCCRTQGWKHWTRVWYIEAPWAKPIERKHMPNLTRSRRRWSESWSYTWYCREEQSHSFVRLLIQVW